MYTVADPGFPGWGGANLRRVHFSVKMYAKTKEMDPVGGRAPAAPPPGSANDQQPRYKYNVENKLNSQLGKDQFTLVVMVIVTSPNNGTIDFCSATTKKDFALAFVCTTTKVQLILSECEGNNAMFRLC